MRDRELEGKMSDKSSLKIGYFHGRFQPFHMGHAWVIEEALKSVDKLIIGFSNPFRQPAILDDAMREDDAVAKKFGSTRALSNNPWPMWARELMVIEGLASMGQIDLRRIMFVPNLSNSGLDVNEMVPPGNLVTIFIVGKEEHNRAKEKQYLSEGYSVVSLDEFDFGGSGTEIRRRIREGESWEDLVPDGTAKVIKWLGELNMGPK